MKTLGGEKSLICKFTLGGDIFGVGPVFPYSLQVYFRQVKISYREGGEH